MRLSLLLASLSMTAIAASATLAAAGCGSADPEPARTPSEGGVLDVVGRADVALEIVDRSYCEPEAIQGFERHWTPPAPADPGACARELVEAALRCLVERRRDDECRDLEGRFPRCFDCLVGKPDPTALDGGDAAADGASSYGPLIVDDGGIARLNVAGCIALLTGDFGEGSCIRDVAAADDCEHRACQHCASPGPSMTDYEACRVVARTGVCKQWADPARVCFNETAVLDADGGVCTSPGSFLDRGQTIALLFCAPATGF